MRVKASQVYYQALSKIHKFTSHLMTGAVEMIFMLLFSLSRHRNIQFVLELHTQLTK